MKKFLLLLLFLLITPISLMADAGNYDIKLSGQFIVIREKRDFPPQKALALNKSVVLSVDLHGDRIIIKTLESEYTTGIRNKEKLRFEKVMTYTFDTKDEQEAKKFFDTFLSELGS